jgi:tungstate transport system ATP-binding protein
MTLPVFDLQGVTKAYGARCVLQVAELAIHPGEILAIVGPSGAGKSTLLRLLNFLEAPSSGEICFEGARMVALDAVPLAVRRRITTVFQRPVLLTATVYENVRYGLRLRGQAIDKNGPDPVMTVLTQVGLADLARQSARTLSGGEQQRVALARALVLQPTVLLLDEPTANLDPAQVARCEALLQQAMQARPMTSVLVTHNLFQARRLAQRVALLLDGQIVELASKEQFFTAPHDPRTKAFIEGEMVY